MCVCVIRRLLGHGTSTYLAYYFDDYISSSRIRPTPNTMTTITICWWRVASCELRHLYSSGINVPTRFVMASKRHHSKDECKEKSQHGLYYRERRVGQNSESKPTSNFSSLPLSYITNHTSIHTKKKTDPTFIYSYIQSSTHSPIQIQINTHNKQL